MTDRAEGRAILDYKKVLKFLCNEKDIANSACKNALHLITIIIATDTRDDKQNFRAVSSVSVSDGFNSGMVKHCREQRLPIYIHMSKGVFMKYQHYIIQRRNALCVYKL